MGEERIHQRAVGVAGRRMHDEPRRLVDHDEVIILIYDRERHGLRQGAGSYGLGNGERHGLAAPQLQRRIGFPPKRAGARAATGLGGFGASGRLGAGGGSGGVRALAARGPGLGGGGPGACWRGAGGRALRLCAAEAGGRPGALLGRGGGVFFGQMARGAWGAGRRPGRMHGASRTQWHCQAFRGD